MLCINNLLPPRMGLRQVESIIAGVALGFASLTPAYALAAPNGAFT
jgi:hypothetical protein